MSPWGSRRSLLPLPSVALVAFGVVFTSIGGCDAIYTTITRELQHQPAPQIAA